MSININNNNNIFVNLSFLLIKKIVCYLDTNVDRFRFSLVCKRWFQERYSYLVLAKRYNSSMLSNAYKSIAYEHKMECELYISSDQLSTRSQDDDDDDDLEEHHIKYITEDELAASGISDNIKSITFAVRNLDVSKYRDMLERSNVEFLVLDSSGFVGGIKLDEKHLPPALHTIIGCPCRWIKSLKHFTSLTTLELADDIPSGFLETGDFPETLTKLDLSWSNSPLDPKMMIPSTIKDLTLSRQSPDLTERLVLPREANYEYLNIYDITYPITPNQLPASIKELVLVSYNQELVPGSLPFGIETLKLPSLSARYMVEGAIPSSTKNLYLFQVETEGTFDARCIPNSVEYLNLGDYTSEIDFSLLPDSIRTIECRLELIEKYGIDSIKPTVTKIKGEDESENLYEYNRIYSNYFVSPYIGLWFIDSAGVHQKIINDKSKVESKSNNNCSTQ
ncbi:hypothetical protein PPL_12513 [Heterostelium album PN500]|uniref:FNIP repeat-containing protein n=1 Tax=Heterostelium pallidum (strain ATCC 26659 / Pp 5 / PN500) TaxID=670386 RepID=D3BMU0_HETP5|nr:hypothetical protein PPL_12513 [Heterostelium album PN500]EFA77302.1 hypothetical protein PPL_12513 [Heterostelium album PN500]|eukprot:XP_020429431.1 hypothetical protein PPL_12513 [Heterostelium album PN500]